MASAAAPPASTSVWVSGPANASGLSVLIVTYGLRSNPLMSGTTYSTSRYGSLTNRPLLLIQPVGLQRRPL
eukprot:CAMPEP_0182929824 /NCGR_PEP_ID=MMETSP0105_2-20130417/22816_1 /TAXON_ID=81532 ORGANISM="Acanthoeca-like sp., Strain 10tr" /NCGR_SAMPLE_ID=MMETSP0105_2 /ASSEMBLY_ACC=CAM_ASM_000205 /LENGTH=70 /DNA_ID=CAMNT_0025068017 /DNA_START=44 /DNA_END=256 /DNA_ORIENTATION=-